ncbi:ketosteroid isomerase-related protein [Tahibacter amnicola]|uniref:Nuclear transport factor 2 family protein n=1 Tax=Tahibacter amnicola TaxID=2976241 RepID=A0ABY6BF88_9GAMM|nr:ketosteroid isomerase-related protein [Tahibacter amnicola]UXI68182.1 nuclear transport factor 2 family protein [Tahibacter amnicola]
MIVDGVRSMDRATELLLRYYTAFNKGDWEGMLSCLSDDVRHAINQGGEEIGVEAFRSFLGRMNRCYKEQLRDIVVMANADGSRGAAEYVVHGQYLQTDEGLPAAAGQRYVLPGGAFFAIEDGLITRVTNYYNLNDWLRQVAP